MSSNPAHVDSYLECFVSRHFGSKHVLLKSFAFLISFLMSFRELCTMPKVPLNFTAFFFNICV